MMLRKFISKYEYTLLLAVLVVCAFGLLLLYSASSYYCINTYHNEFYLVIRQSIFLAVGIVVLFVVSFVPYKLFLKSSFLIYMLSLVFVLLTFFIGVASRGSTRWVDINGITFQPSELMKVALIIHLSNLGGSFLEHKNSYNEVKYQKEMIKIISIGLIPSVLISISNLSTGIICVLITITYIFLISKKKLIFLIMILICFSIFFFKYPISLIIEKMGILKQYQINRILAWVSPKEYQDIAYQTNQSLYAIGSGGLFGRGIGESLQKMIIPEAHNDMIFAVLVEEVGIVGSLFFIFLYILLVYRIFYLSLKKENIYGKLVLCGIGMHIFIQVILNVSVCLNIIPNTGVTLPFMSYGGSSLLVFLFEIGICLSICREEH